ncbi:hypothetical protein SCP_0905670 [Sparassis crispa]|uniref:Uncharacterized protein n=1 Tax=Sparassis crispa TaxID=139825 RepID=A0A401GWT6_9APHY|nr:hypothetical protein SCP_0905670 [Sparassis crispa]GBE86687.1 hypothetical protein SCP_0905670 [Sparassis crispa]
MRPVPYSAAPSSGSALGNTPSRASQKSAPLLEANAILQANVELNENRSMVERPYTPCQWAKMTQQIS